jgi:hypothetical protein
MLLRTRTQLLLGCLAATACGPESKDANDWMIGVFSSPGPGNMSLGLDSVTHYEFLEDGTLLVGGVSGCASNAPRDSEARAWIAVGKNSLRIDDPAPGSVIEAWSISRGQSCGDILVDTIIAGQVTDTTSWTRGEVCLQELSPCAEGTSCETCKTVWCDDEPPDCD